MNKNVLLPTVVVELCMVKYSEWFYRIFEFFEPIQKWIFTFSRNSKLTFFGMNIKIAIYHVNN